VHRTCCTLSKCSARGGERAAELCPGLRQTGLHHQGSVGGGGGGGDPVPQ
jgi:hypothetical protein